MKQLAQQQDQFLQFILTGQAGIEDAIVPTEFVSVETRLGIYRDGYKLRLIESLGANYPAMLLYLGTEEFDKLAGAYIDKHPSHYRSIRWYGDVLSEFTKNYYSENHAYMAELAEFEWKMTLAFDSKDEQSVKVEDMGIVPPESWAGLQFTAHSSVQRMDFFWNVVLIWQTLVKDEALPDLDKKDKATAWVLWRSPDYIIQFYSLSEEEAWALDVMIQGLSFGELCEGLCQWVAPEDVGLRAATYLKGWIQNGMLSQLLITD